MTVVSSDLSRQRLASDAGIAIGPILFIIAVLGILAAAIAAGSGSFTTSTTGESNRAKAAALIDIGQTLKIGFDRLVGGGTDFFDVNIDPADITDTVDLFSPNGGGISPPSRTMSDDPANDEWHYPLVAVPGICTSTGCRLAIIQVGSGVCLEINNKAAAITIAQTAVALDDMTADTGTTPVDGTNWPADLQGKPTGCVRVNANGGMDAGYYFYQIMGVQ